MDDIEFHVPTAFQVGDRVDVIKAVPRAKAWYAEPTSSALTSNARIQSRDPLFGFSLEKNNAGLGWYPSCALRIAEIVTVVIEVPSI